MFYSLKKDYSKKFISNLEIEVPNFDEYHDVLCGTGDLIKTRKTLVIDIIYKKSKSIPDYFDIGRFSIVSDKLKDFLIANDVNAQFLNIKLIKNNTKSVSDNFYIFNLLDKVNCLDLKKSEYELRAESPGHFKKIKKLVFLKEKKYPNVFIIDKYFIPSYFVKDSFKQALVEEKFSGMRFVGLEDYIF